MVGIEMGADEQGNIARSKSQCFEDLNHIIYLHAHVIEGHIGAVSWRTSINENVGAIAHLDQVARNGHSVFDECQVQAVETKRGGLCDVHGRLPQMCDYD